MCLAIPGTIIAIENNKAKIDYSGIVKSASCDLVPDVIVGDIVLVHAGFIIQKLDTEYGNELKELSQEVF